MIQMKGYFITFEGIDGCGKTTQVKLLADRLSSLGYNVLTTREPGGCPLSDKIREILLDKDNQISPQMEVYLFAASRAQHVQEVIKPALEAGKVVISDRFVDSSVAYQGGGRGLGIDIIRQINGLAVDGCVPDRVLILRADPEVSIKRREKATEKDRIEQSNIRFHHAVSKSFDDIAVTDQRYCIIDAEASIEAIHNKILDIARLDLGGGYGSICFR
jgi:dTMP kinase